MQPCVVHISANAPAPSATAAPGQPSCRVHLAGVVAAYVVECLELGRGRLLLLLGHGLSILLGTRHHLQHNIQCEQKLSVQLTKGLYASHMSPSCPHNCCSLNLAHYTSNHSTPQILTRNTYWGDIKFPSKPHRARCAALCVQCRTARSVWLRQKKLMSQWYVFFVTLPPNPLPRSQSVSPAAPACAHLHQSARRWPSSCACGS